jgi:hypothetical protein
MRSLVHRIYASEDMRPSSVILGLLQVTWNTTRTGLPSHSYHQPACIHNLMLCFLLLLFSVYIPLFLTHWALASSGWIENTHSGYATMTHYTMAPGYIASCGCTGTSTDYPTAALSQMAYGSSVNYGALVVVLSRSQHRTSASVGPACGRCFKLTLLNPIIATPPFHPNVEKSVVVKVTDLCPLSSAGWCSGTKSKPNS